MDNTQNARIQTIPTPGTQARPRLKSGPGPHRKRNNTNNLQLIKFISRPSHDKEKKGVRKISLEDLNERLETPMKMPDGNICTIHVKGCTTSVDDLPPTKMSSLVMLDRLLGEKLFHFLYLEELKGRLDNSIEQEGKVDE